MSKKSLGFIVPISISLITGFVVFFVKPEPTISWGIIAGLMLALVQSFASTGALTWAWEKHFFYWIWGGGMLFRLLVFAATAFVVYRYTSLNFVATMITMVTATTLFLVIEAATFFK